MSPLAEITHSMWCNVDTSKIVADHHPFTAAAVQILMTRIEENPLSDWANPLSQIVRAALDCQGKNYTFGMVLSCIIDVRYTAFTPEQMGKLSDILEAALPRSTSSPPPTHTPRSRSSASSRQSSYSGRAVHSPGALQIDAAVGNLAKEFGVDPLVVEALAQRLAAIH